MDPSGMPSGTRRRLDSGRTLTVVSGLPRSGTSLMMQMLEAAGLALAVDDRRAPDVDNPRGYYELDAVRRIRDDASFLAALAGRAVKIVVPLVRDLPSDLDYRVLLMDRDLGEVLASQRAMLERRSEGDGRDDAPLARAFERQLRDVKSRLEAAENVALCVVDHHALLSAPDAACDRIAGFLEATGALVRVDGGRIDPGQAARRMASIVDPSLYRRRAARPAEAVPD